MFSRKMLLIVFSVFVAMAFCTMAEADVTAISVEGNVRVVREGSSVGSRCEVGTVFYEGDWVSVPHNAHILLSYDEANENTLYVGANTLVAINSFNAPERVELFEGVLIARLNALEPGETFKIRTPVATCGARGTAWQVTTDGAYADISVFENDVFMIPLDVDGTETGVEYMINEGFSRTIRKNEEPSEMRALTNEDIERMEKTIPQLLKNADRIQRERPAEEASVSENGGTSSGIMMVNGVGVNRDRYEIMNGKVEE